MERGDLIVALGGGVIGDLAGFAASVVRARPRLCAGADHVVGACRLLGPAARPRSIRRTARTSSAPSISRSWSLPIPRCSMCSAAPVPRRLRRSRQIRAARRRRLLRLARGQLARDFRGRQLFREFCARARHRGDCRAKAAIVARDERETGERQLLNLGNNLRPTRSKRPAASPIGCCTARRLPPAWRSLSSFRQGARGWPRRRRPRASSAIWLAWDCRPQSAIFRARHRRLTN